MYFSVIEIWLFSFRFTHLTKEVNFEPPGGFPLVTFPPCCFFLRAARMHVFLQCWFYLSELMVIALWDDSQLVVSSLFLKADQCTLQLKLSSSPCLNSLSHLTALGNTHNYMWNKTATGHVSWGASCSSGQPSAGAHGPWAGFTREA